MGVRYTERWGEVSMRLDRNIAAGIRKAAIETDAEIVTQIMQKNLVDTGKYFRSWTFDIAADGKSAVIGSPVEYGPYLEYGHAARRSKKFEGPPKWVSARPHVVPAARLIARRISTYFQRLDQ